jgi:phage FluMu protein Com
MAIEFRCTQCGKLLRVGDDSAGKRAKCPGCGTVLAIPGGSAPAPSQAAPPSPFPPAAGAPEPPRTGPAVSAPSSFGQAAAGSSSGKTLPNKGIDPILALVANFFCLNILGYILLGQVKKGLWILLVAIGPALILLFIAIPLSCITKYAASLFLLSPLTSLWSIFVTVLGLIDVFQVATAVKAGEAIDENGYKLPLLHNLMKLIDKSAVLNA